MLQKFSIFVFALFIRKIIDTISRVNILRETVNEDWF